MGSCTLKVPEGKLLRIDASNGKVLITGDFFLYPEEKLSLIETLLSESAHDVPCDVLSRNIKELCTEHKVLMVGISPRAVAECFLAAVAEGDSDV